MTDAGTQSGQSTSTAHLGDVRNILGLLLAGFGGALGFLGIRSTELSDVLRNNGDVAALICLVLLLGILTAVASVFVPDDAVIDSSGGDEQPSQVTHVPFRMVVGIGLILISLFFFLVTLIPNQPISWTTGRYLVVAIGGVLVVPGLVMMLLGWRDRTNLHRGLSLQLSLILVAVVLISTSAYGAMRIESRSQKVQTAELSASVEASGSTGSISMRFDASKLPDIEYLQNYVYGVPQSFNLAKACEQIPQFNPPCESDPCYDLSVACTVISDGRFIPDDSGQVDQTLKLPFDPADYQTIDIRDFTCALPFVCQNDVANTGSRITIRLRT